MKPDNQDPNSQPGQSHAIVSGQPNDQPTAPTRGGGMPPKGKKPLLIIAAIVVVLGLAIGGYVLLSSDDESVRKAGEATRKSQDAADDSAVDLSTQSDITLKETTFPGYHRDEARSGDTYVQYSSDDRSCGIVYGIFTEAQFPGDTSAEIVEGRINELRSTGATVEAPSAGEALVVRDTNDPSVTYNMPTLAYAAAQGQDHIAFRFSIVILADGKRAAINRFCANERDGQPIPESKMDSLDALSKEITVTTTQ